MFFIAIGPVALLLILRQRERENRQPSFSEFFGGAQLLPFYSCTAWLRTINGHFELTLSVQEVTLVLVSVSILDWLYLCKRYHLYQWPIWMDSFCVRCAIVISSHFELTLSMQELPSVPEAILNGLYLCHLSICAISEWAYPNFPETTCLLHILNPLHDNQQPLWIDASGHFEWSLLHKISISGHFELFLSAWEVPLV